MSSPTYTFNFTMAEETLSQMSSISNAITTMLSDLETSVQASLTEWNSTARDQYNTAKATWDAAAARMPAALARGQQALQTISEGYGNAEAVGVQMWSGA